MKHSVAVDTDKQAIISAINSISWHNDNVYFEPLARKTKEIVYLNNVTADMGYDSEANHILIREELKGNSIIPIRTTSLKAGVHKFRYGHYRKELHQNFPWKDYHQRSKIEKINFVEKRKFGDELRSKLLKMQKRELRVIDVVYNLYRYINYFLWLGFLQNHIEPIQRHEK